MEQKLLDSFLDSNYFVTYYETSPTLHRAVISRLENDSESTADSREITTITKGDLIELVFEVIRKYNEKKVKWEDYFQKHKSG